MSTFGLFGTFGVLNWPQPAGRQAYAKINTATQQKLKDLGFDPGAIDGLLGNQTKTAVAAFEKSWGLPADESWADFLDSLDIAYKGRSTGGTAAAKPVAPSQSQIMTTAAGGGSFLDSIKAKLKGLNFQDPKVIAGAGIVGLGIVLFLMPKGSGSKGRRKGRR